MSKSGRARLADSSSENSKRERVSGVPECPVCGRVTAVFMGTNSAECSHFVCTTCHHGIANSANPNKCPQCRRDVVWVRNRLADSLAALHSDDIPASTKIEQHLSGAFLSLDIAWRLTFKNLDAGTILDVVTKLDNASHDEKAVVAVFNNLNGVIATTSFNAVFEKGPRFYSRSYWNDFEVSHNGGKVGCICVEGGFGADGGISKTLLIQRNGAAFTDNNVVPQHLKGRVKLFSDVTSNHIPPPPPPPAAVPHSPLPDNEEVNVQPLEIDDD